MRAFWLAHVEVFRNDLFKPLRGSSYMPRSAKMVACSTSGMASFGM